MIRREVPVEDAIGLALAHDMTRIVPGEFKGRQFKRGHVVREEDIPVLLDMGKRHLYILELEPGELHEDDAALRMAQAIAGEGVELSEVSEGKVILRAKRDGMLWVDARRVTAMNTIDEISIATKRPFQHVTRGTSLAAVRPIPLVIAEDKVRAVEVIASQAQKRAVIDVLPYQPQKVRIVTTGSEILHGRVEDKFGPVLRAKLARYGIQDVHQVFVGDERDRIADAIVEACEQGATLVLVTGGMSVDPDDRSPGAIRDAATEVVTYGTPMLPGSMLMLAYRNDTAIFGLPGAVIYDPITSFDRLLPRVLTGLRVRKRDIAVLGVGGWLNA
ncbi:molybdopterin-binding protein [Alicyclobacillus acidocaldarius]|uniref:Molybdopterin molybdenumtransferase n=1 Tax=Alicyclobacillus acidocaldarius subsp. acidocaldarius (strain ATCC 27009 / DSM 446 / BCRC 14685 / JCM 5260 / KCTC 1825 / NBRC 15652 / NCIMB 11725 / NRRL B-14509 / 104-IA) TaxID=521098 RepID=C8WS02_ALIAD|nr:molybdopterin-binding protein [Alicyclobacillus acidocaldarius]ACV57436.1 molybdopterin binding domain protein [Alicyclobacillus acidocaldarius subsp. acidocaldarius DSM 446]